MKRRRATEARHQTPAANKRVCMEHQAKGTCVPAAMLSQSTRTLLLFAGVYGTKFSGSAALFFSHAGLFYKTAVAALE